MLAHSSATLCTLLKEEKPLVLCNIIKRTTASLILNWNSRQADLFKWLIKWHFFCCAKKGINFLSESFLKSFVKICKFWFSHPSHQAWTRNMWPSGEWEECRQENSESSQQTRAFLPSHGPLGTSWCAITRSTYISDTDVSPSSHKYKGQSVGTWVQNRKTVLKGCQGAPLYCRIHMTHVTCPQTSTFL